MFSKITLCLVAGLSLLASHGSDSQARQSPSGEDGWTTLTIGQTVYGIKYFDPGAVIVNNNLVMSCVPDQQSAAETKLYVSRPSPLKKFVLVLCSQYPGDQAYVIDTVHRRAVSRDAVPKHWNIIKWLSWSPYEKFAVVAAAGEEPMGDMAFVDLGTGEMREVHFKDVTNNPRTDRHERLQDFDPDAVVWLNPTTFRLNLTVHCNPYEYGDACKYEKILSSNPARVNLNPFSISYGNTGQPKSSRSERRLSARNSPSSGIRSVNSESLSIRQIDFANYTYDLRGSDCQMFGRTLKVRNGEFGNFGGDGGFSVNSDIVYGDLTGDGQDEAIVRIA